MINIEFFITPNCNASMQSLLNWWNCTFIARWCTLWCSAWTLPMLFLPSKYCTLSWKICKCNFIYAHKKSVAFLAPLFLKLTNVEQHYIQIPYTKYHAGWANNLVSVVRTLFFPINCGCNCAYFHETISQ